MGGFSRCSTISSWEDLAIGLFRRLSLVQGFWPCSQVAGFIPSASRRWGSLPQNQSGVIERPHRPPLTLKKRRRPPAEHRKVECAARAWLGITGSPAAFATDARADSGSRIGSLFGAGLRRDYFIEADLLSTFP